MRMAPGRGLEEGLDQIIIIGAQFGDVEFGFGEAMAEGPSAGFVSLSDGHSFAAASGRPRRGPLPDSGSSAASGLPWSVDKGGIGVALVQLRCASSSSVRAISRKCSAPRLAEAPLRACARSRRDSRVMGADGMAEEAASCAWFLAKLCRMEGYCCGDRPVWITVSSEKQGAETPMIPHRARKAAPDFRPALPNPVVLGGAGYGWCRRAAPV